LIIPSTQQVAENIQRTVEGIAVEIGRRVAAATDETTGNVAHIQARNVLLDWFLGDFLPTPVAQSLQPPETAK
jgi:hypothetical protein